jgi:mannosyltransferase OCH1-like enzyme
MDYNYNYPFPYVTVSYASGQWFETAIWAQYHAMLPNPEKTPGQENRLYRLMMDDRFDEGADPWVFFTQARGGTWIRWDNRMFLWIGDHVALIIIGVLSLAGLSV